MKEYEVLQQQNYNIADSERAFYDQTSFEKRSKEEKVGMFKEYLFLQAKIDRRYDPKNSEKIYDSISEGSHKLDDILETIADRIKDGGSCVRELQSRFMKDAVYENASGEVTADGLLHRDDYIESVKDQSTGAFHRTERRALVEETAGRMQKREADAEKLEAELDRIKEETEQAISRDKQSGDLDYVIDHQKQASEFARELDDAEREAGIDESDVIRELFPENVYEEARQIERDDRGRIFRDAVNHDPYKEEVEDPELDLLQKQLEDAEKDIPSVLGELNLTEEAKKEAGKKQDTAAKVSEEFEQAEQKGEKEYDEMMIGELFSKEASVESPEEEKNEVQDHSEIKTEEKKTAQDFMDELDAAVKDEEQKKDPKVEEMEQAYREVDRIEQLCKDQDAFEQLNSEEKMKLADSYLLHNGKISPDIEGGFAYRLEEGIKSYECQDSLRIICDNIRSGENFLAELNSFQIRTLAYAYAMPGLYNAHEAQPSNLYRNKVMSIARNEEKEYEKYGTYSGKPKQKKSEIEKEAEDLGALFPENDEVKKKEAKKKEQKAKEAEERIRKKKDARLKAIQDKAEAKKKLEESGIVKAFQKDIRSQIAKEMGRDTRSEEEKLITMTSAEAKQLARRIKVRMLSSEFKSMSNGEKKKLSRNLLFCRAKEEPDVFMLADSPEGSDKEKAIFRDFHHALQNSIALEIAFTDMISVAKSGRAFYNLLDSSLYLKTCIQDMLKEESLFEKDTGIPRYKKDFDQKIKEIKVRRKKEAEVRENPKKAEKNYDNYITLHTGSMEGKSPREMFDNLTKAAVAIKLRDAGASFDMGQIHETAKRLGERLPASKMKDAEFVEKLKPALEDTDSLKAFMSDLNTAMFHVDLKNVDKYKADMKKILESMEAPDKRSVEYQKMYRSIEAITKLNTKYDDSNKDQVEQRVIRANENLFDSIQNYTKNKEGIRFWDKGQVRFNHSMDALATVTKYAPGTRYSTMVVINRINTVRKGKEPIPKNLGEFTKAYGADQSAKTLRERKAEAKNSINKKTAVKKVPPRGMGL